MFPTAKDLERSQRYLDRLLRDKERALARMRERGAALHHTHRPGRSLWALSDGTPVRDAVAAALTRDARVVGVGDALFGRELSQTFRYYDETDAPDPGAPLIGDNWAAVKG